VSLSNAERWMCFKAEQNPTFDLSATMGDYPTSGKLCPESNGIKLVSRPWSGHFRTVFFCEDQSPPNENQCCYSGR
jgi:hypothetical protein